MCQQQDVAKVLTKYTSNVKKFPEFHVQYNEYPHHCISNFKVGYLMPHIAAWKDRGI